MFIKTLAHITFCCTSWNDTRAEICCPSAHLMGTERSNPSGLKASGYGEPGWSQPCGQGWAPTATPGAIEGNCQNCWELDWKPLHRLIAPSLGLWGQHPTYMLYILIPLVPWCLAEIYTSLLPPQNEVEEAGPYTPAAETLFRQEEGLAVTDD